MDDLDHSMYIAEYDWMSFYGESEECNMLQPPLACHDSSNLSDTEDSEFASPASSTGQQETLQSPDVNCDGAESKPAGCSTKESCIQLLVQLNESSTEGEQGYDTRKTVEESVTQEDGLICPAGNTLNTKEVHMKISGMEKTNTPPTELLHAQCSGLSKEMKKYLQIEMDNSINEPHPQIHNQAKLNRNEPHTAEGTVREDVSSATATTEKEHWFVIVNDSPAQDRPRANSVKKKQGQKKPSKISRMCNLRQEKSLEKGLEFKIHKYKNESQGGRDTWVQKGGRLSAETNSESASDLLQINCEEDAMSFPHSFTKHITEPILDKNEPTSSTLHDTLNQKDPSHLESVELEELEDNVEFFSVHSYESETYLSAAESVEEPQHLEDHLMEKQLQSSVCLSTKSHLLNQTESVNTEDTQDRVLNSCHNTVSCHVSPTSYDGQKANKIPETYAQATGHTRPMYAISAFWDEMEKLTIHDILQLKMVRNTPPNEPQETVTSNLDDSPTNCSSVVDTVGRNLSYGGPMNTMDAADSDYFTQPDEFQPHCSSCELSTSDFEEDYWQFIGTSRNHSPDLQDKNQQRRCDSFFSHEEDEEFTSSDGKETPVLLDDFAEQFTEHQESHIFGALTEPRQISKSTSMYNVQALSTEDSALQTLFGNDESSLFFSRCQSLEEKVSDSLETPMALLSNTDILDEHYQIPFPELFEFFSTEDKANNDSRCVTVYHPENISESTVFDYNLCTFRDELSFCSLHDSECSEEKPIPIFSSSHPTVRELTFPKWDHVFLSAEHEEEDMSPIRVMSQSFTQARDSGATAADGSLSWKSWLMMRKICFHDKVSIWCQRSGPWVFPGEAENMINKRKDPSVIVLNEGRVSPAPREPAVQQTILETIPTSREGIFSTLKQSDMCLVCIAFASWVLRSSDPEAADAWKAALLANVSALSAIQYLRQYVKKTNPI
ncbi:uncharacterized protein perm1b [Mastacembelus armatus]|uniref:uncharacterized protein perm1b n=1 Tax=Mastacembelus armatus TaxID=205130 RepID=UPI000E455EE8|nr:uncharacterized protein LOC113130025 [Mastacembelus armatus]